MSRRRRQQHDEFLILRELNGHMMLTPRDIGSNTGVRGVRLGRALENLEQRGHIHTVSMIDRHQYPLELTGPGHDRLRAIEPWHNQSWRKRCFGPPPP